jgi:protein subunit release factor B
MALSFPVSAPKLENLRARMKALNLKEEDMEETFFKASGPGGQKTNKTQTGVAILHEATGVRVRCQRERSQGINRFLARRLLVEELEARLQNKTRHQLKGEKIREEKERKGRRTKKPATVQQNVYEQFLLRKLPGS